MKKKLCTLFVCILLVLSFASVSAEEISVVSVADGIEMSSLSYENEAFAPETDITLKLTAKRTEQGDSTDKLILVASLLDNGVMTAVDTDSKVLGTENTEFTATLTLPADVSGCEITVALLKQTEGGLVPVGSASYIPSREDFLPFKSVTIGGKELDFDEYNEATVIYPPKSTSYPKDLSVQVADAATEVDWVLYDAEEPVYGVITASLPNGNSVEYRVNYEERIHAVYDSVAGKTVADFIEADDTNVNMVAENTVVTVNDSTKDAIYNNLYTNLQGTDDEARGMGSIATANLGVFSKYHEISYVAPEFEGLDYIVTYNNRTPYVSADGATSGNGAVPGENFIEFMLSDPANVHVFTYTEYKELDTKYGFVGETGSSAYIIRRYINTKPGDEYKKATGEVMNWSEANRINASGTFKEEDTAYFNSISEGLADKLAALKQSGAGSKFNYKYKYTKTYSSASVEEPALVEIPYPTASQSRGWIVVIEPIAVEE